VLCRFRLDDLNAPPWHIDAVTGASTKSLPGYRLLAISEVARPAGIHTSQLFRWRQQLCERVQVPAAFNPVANGHPKPYVWTKTATEIFSKVARAKQVLESQH
jgi:transposase-like protein